MRNKGFLLIILSFITIILSLYQNREECYYCALIIILYYFIYWGKIEIYKYLNSICGFFVFFLTFVRYFIIPLLIIFDDGYMSFKPMGIIANELFFINGSLITIWEMILCGWYISLSFPKWFSQKVYNEPIKFKTPVLTWTFFLLVFSSLIIVHPSVLSNYSLVFNLKPDDSVLEETISLSTTETIAMIGVRVSKIILPIPLLCVLYRNYQHNNSLLSYLIGLFVVVFCYGFIIEGNSRNSIVIPAVAAIFILSKLFPKYTRSMLILIIPSILLVIILSTVWKSFSGDKQLAYDNSFSAWISYIEAYFAGISNMGKAIYAYQQYDYLLNPVMAFHDICKNIPFVNVLTDTKATSSYYFQSVWGRTDQVIPATGNGLFYFGYIFAPCVSILFIRLSHYFDSLKDHASSLPEYVIYCYSCSVVSYNIYNSVSTMMMKLTITIIPLLFIVFISKQINRQKYDCVKSF